MVHPTRATDVGFCLDVDGTLHRSGSVFVETLAHLGYCGALDLDETDRQHRREVIETVVEYGAGPDARRRWGRLLTGLDVLAESGGAPLADATVTALERAHTVVRKRRDDLPAGTSAHVADGDAGLDYRTMQRQALDAYGAMIAGRRADTVERAARKVVSTHVETDPVVADAVERLRAAGATVCLVTDAPAHAARAYADVMTGSGNGVAATRYHVDAAGRYTGEYTLVDKDRAVRRLRRIGEWDRLVAGGDAVVDLAMAPSADCFLAVAGEGGLLDALDAPAGPAVPSGCTVVRVDRDRSVGTALLDALERVTDRPVAAPEGR